MKVKNIDLPMDKIADFCQRWKVIEFSLFGSVLRDDFRPDSDIDILVKWAPDAGTTFSDLDEMEEELKSLFGRDVDLVSKRAIENSLNYLRRKAILNSAELIYVRA
ncbi:nucleotidyltransferase family protein [Ancylothrix sp. C2]|uniref:nucleotidyltransferase family protein n=1 Tax=Ancylothrix sp. D3o TaxID=2953691 RepID=UPI0021BB6F53|nr:nucleotidyltransferase family protein [Ancylothrix sp. D3o]MCT7952006.1 nucleotidyltransferase family protein [Ancylothrix sp. D3o]